MEKDYISGIVDSGIEFVSSKSIEKNSVVELEVTLPNVNRTVNAICKVAWIHKVARKYEIGMRFYEIDPPIWRRSSSISPPVSRKTNQRPGRPRPSVRLARGKKRK